MFSQDFYNILTLSCRPDNLHKEPHHGLRALSAVPLDAGELCGQVVVKVLGAEHLQGQTLLLLGGQLGAGVTLEGGAEPGALRLALEVNVKFLKLKT